MRILLCEDDVNDLQHERLLLMQICSKCGIVDLELICVTKMAEARFILQSRRVDIVLLDIFLQDGLGLELAKWLRKQDSKCALIFITTSRDYAVESYEVNACYYLLKPLEETEFLKALQKASSQFGSQDYLVVTHDYNDIRIRYTDINYIEANHKQAIFYFKDGTNTTSYINLDDLAKKFFGFLPVRCLSHY